MKLTVVVSYLLLAFTIFVVTLYKWSVFLVFRREGISYCRYRRSPLWIHQVNYLQPAEWYDLKQIFEEGEYCAYEVYKHLNCRSKKLGCQNELRSSSISTYLGFKMNILSISLAFSPKRKYFYGSIVKKQNHIITKKFHLFSVLCETLSPSRFFSAKSAVSNTGLRVYTT